MAGLRDVLDQAIADYGFRQAVMWGPDDVAREWGLTEAEQQLLQTSLIPALESLPVPVEPSDVPAEQARLGQVIRDAGLGD